MTRVVTARARSHAPLLLTDCFSLLAVESPKRAQAAVAKGRATRSSPVAAVARRPLLKFPSEAPAAQWTQWIGAVHQRLHVSVTPSDLLCRQKELHDLREFAGVPCGARPPFDVRDPAIPPRECAARRAVPQHASGRQHLHLRVTRNGEVGHRRLSAAGAGLAR